MPIIPSSWTGQQIFNAISSSGGSSGFPVYKFSKSENIALTELDTYIDLIPVVDEPINREVSLDLILGRVKLYWKDLNNHYSQVHKDSLIFNSGSTFVDLTLGQLGLSVKVSEPTELFYVLRWDKDIISTIVIEDDLMINPEVRLLLPTGTNYPEWEMYDIYDGNSYTYQQNLQRLKNSDSGITGYKLFDIYSFYPGKLLNFNVNVLNPSNYGSIHLQLLDPLDIAQAAMDIASDLVNPELEDLPNNFIGRLTKNAWYKDIIDNVVEVKPDFSRHVGRFVAQNVNNNNAYDTCIIAGYTPNIDNPLLGGTFTLTGDF